MLKFQASAISRKYVGPAKRPDHKYNKGDCFLKKTIKAPETVA